jgi:hypothetical protein
MRIAGLGFVLLTLLFPTAAIALPSRGPGADGDRAEVEQIVRDSIGWALTKDRARLESILSQGEDLFMFQPTWDATVVGWESLVRAFDLWMDPRFRATHFDVRDLRISFSRSGDVAWFSAILDDFGEWDGTPVGWKDTRWTGVLERRDGDWIIVQMHFSFAADKVVDAAREDGSSDGHTGGDRGSGQAGEGEPTTARI